MVDRANNVTKFKDMRLDFLCFKDEGLTIHSCYKDKQNMPKIFIEMYKLLKKEVPSFKEKNDYLLLKRLIYLANDKPYEIILNDKAITIKEGLFP